MFPRRFIAFAEDPTGGAPAPAPPVPAPGAPEPTEREKKLLAQIAELEDKIKKGEIKGASESTLHALLERLNALQAKLDAAEKAETKRGFRLFF